MKISAKTKDCRLLVKVKTSRSENFDERAADAFARIYLRGFLKPKLVKKDLIEYSGPVGISLYERLKKPISKRDFFFIMEQIIVTIQKIRNNNLSLNRLMLDIRYCFINDITKELQFLYVPTENVLENPGVIAFMESIIYSVIPAGEQDNDFVSRFVYFLKGLKGFSPEAVEKYIYKEDRAVVDTIRWQNAGQSGYMTNNRKSHYDHYEKKQEELAEKTGIIAENDEATGLLDEETEATGLLDESEDEETDLLNEEAATDTAPMIDDEEETALLKENVVHFPSLFRVFTQETISVNKPVFRIGKERSYVDYFVTNNDAVSRSHADIVTRGTKYFVLDLNSKNHTYINGQILPIQCETEIRDGDRLKLGNEEFIFNV